VYEILRAFEATDEKKQFRKGWEVQDSRGHDFKWFKKRVNLNVGKFSFGIRVCDEWNMRRDRLSMRECESNYGHFRPLSQGK